MKRRTKALKKIMNKLAAVFAAGVTAVCCLPSGAFADELQGAEEPLYDGSFYYELNDDHTYTITKCVAITVTEVPSIRNGTAITRIGEGAFANCTGIGGLTIPDSVTEIEKNAFYDCPALKKITLPRKLKSLGDHAFFGCSSLESIEIPDTVTLIEPYTFALCDNLGEVKLGDNVIEIGDYAFYQCSRISSFRLPASLETIGDNAMGSWFSVSDIDASANSSFVYEDNMLTDKEKTKIYRASAETEGELVIPEGVNEICSGAFSACAKITALHMPPTVRTIGDEAFRQCSGLKNVDFSEGLETIGMGAFLFDQNILSLNIPTTVKKIDELAFAYCMKLNKIILPEGAETIGKEAFLVCDELKQISIPKSVKEIGENALGYTVENSERQKLEGFNMSVFSGSAGEKYAKSEKIDYTVTDVNIKRVAFIAAMIGLIIAALVFAVTLMKRSKKTADAGARKAAKKAKELEEEKKYRKIMADEEQSSADEEKEQEVSESEDE